MMLRSTLALACALAALAPAPSAAGPNKFLTAVNVTGNLQLEVNGPFDHIQGTIPIQQGRVEILEGPYIKPVGKQFVLTRLMLKFPDFIIHNTSKGDLYAAGAGLHLRDTLTWWGLDAQVPIPGPNGAYKIDIAHNAVRITGDPTFVGGAVFNPKGKADYYNIEDRVSEPIVGVINLDANTFEMTITLRGTHYVPIFPDYERKLVIKLSGKFEKPGKLPVPSDPPTDPKDPKIPTDPKAPPTNPKVPTKDKTTCPAGTTFCR